MNTVELNTVELNTVEMNTVPVVEKKPRKPKAKVLPAKEKKMMCSIVGYLVHLRAIGVLDHEKSIELIEHLPIYKSVEEQLEFFDHELFNVPKKVEKEIIKTMVQHYKKSQKPVKEPKVRRPRAPKAKAEKKVEVTSENVEVTSEKVETDASEKKKRGRKQKQQIMVLNQEEENEEKNVSNSEENIDTDELAKLIADIEQESSVIEEKTPEVNTVSEDKELEEEPIVTAVPEKTTKTTTKKKNTVKFSEDGTPSEKPVVVKKPRAKKESTVTAQE